MSRGTLPQTTTPQTNDQNERLRLMLFALGGALRGDPQFAQQTLALKEKGIERQQNAELQQALAEGNTDKALSLAARMGKTSVVQYLQGERTRTRPQLISDGKFTVTYNEQGMPVVTPNEEVIEAELDIAKRQAELEKETRTLPPVLIKSEDEDFDALQSLEKVETDIDFFINSLDKNEMEVGYGEDLQAKIGNLGVLQRFMDEESKLKLANYNAFERWKQRYVNESLRLNKGPQTEGDAQRAMLELEAAKTKEDVKRLLEDLKKTNTKSIGYTKEDINRRRSTAGVKPFDFNNISWKIIEQ
jgi:hypothetical protein